MNMHIYNQLQANYAELHGKAKSTAVREASIHRLYRLLSPHCPLSRGSALDLGAGQGELLVALSLLGFQDIVGVEVSPSQVQLAISHGCYSVRLGDGGSFLASLPDSSVDLICCFDVFEHLSHDTCAHWFEQIFRVLRPGGRLIGHVPNGISPFVGSLYWCDLTHIWCPVPRSIQVFCRYSHLRWIGAYENIGSSPGVKGRLRSISWLFVRTLLACAHTIESGRLSFAMPWSRTFLFVVERPVSS
jgi:SAM-dependent methyltransferase